MKVLITAGNTMTMIDKVRGITNVFKGKTGAAIATEFFERGHDVTLLTSNPEVIHKCKSKILKQCGMHLLVKLNLLTRFKLFEYKTYDELYLKMKELITTQQFDVIIHSAAVSDYKVEGTYINNNDIGHGTNLIAIDSSAKISSNHDEIYLRLIPTEKIIDRIREWGFKGILVKFKLQVGITDEELIEIAKKSRIQSNADLIVANTLEGSKSYAYIIAEDTVPIRVTRDKLPSSLEVLLNKE